jgi:hypothetical protein
MTWHPKNKPRSHRWTWDPHVNAHFFLPYPCSQFQAGVTLASGLQRGPESSRAARGGREPRPGGIASVSAPPCGRQPCRAWVELLPPSSNKWTSSFKLCPQKSVLISFQCILMLLSHRTEIKPNNIKHKFFLFYACT